MSTGRFADSSITRIPDAPKRLVAAAAAYCAFIVSFAFAAAMVFDLSLDGG